jgi:chemotaxis-related protein WspD
MEEHMAFAAHDDATPVPRIDACWNRIGTHGDGSCPRLTEYVRCLNCPVLSRGATMLLDRPPDEAESEWASGARLREEEAPITDGERGQEAQSVFAFRVVDEWLALPVSALRQVDMPRPIHPLPHRRNGIVLGLVNVRGMLTVAASLADMLNLDRSAAGRHASRLRRSRTLVAEHLGETAALPVDEVEGVIRFAADAWMPSPATLTHSAAVHARGVIRWRDTTVGVLDPGRLFESLARSLR